MSKPSPILVNIGEHSSVSYRSDSFELSTKKMQFLVLFALILIIVLATTTYVCVVKIRKLNNMLTTNNKSFDERIQILVIQLDSCQLKMSMRNIIIYSNSCITRESQSSVYSIWKRLFKLSMISLSVFICTDFFKDSPCDI